jgi:hypothetical protein
MSIKLVLLKSGEDIISDLSEMVVGEEENRVVVGYFFNKPCIVKMRTPSQNLLTEENGGNIKRTNYEVSLFPWMPLCKDEIIPVAADWVVTMVEPVEKLKNMYIEDVINHGKEIDKDIIADEQSDSDQSD